MKAGAQWQSVSVGTTRTAKRADGLVFAAWPLIYAPRSHSQELKSFASNTSALALGLNWKLSLNPCRVLMKKMTLMTKLCRNLWGKTFECTAPHNAQTDTLLVFILLWGCPFVLGSANKLNLWQAWFSMAKKQVYLAVYLRPHPEGKKSFSSGNRGGRGRVGGYGYIRAK